jgi:predicted lysophospholipase L1 biosynthesis ABC-type transport system permease subunit
MIAANPLYSEVAVMWNSTFMMDTLGPRAFNQTFGAGQTNYLIVKVDNVSDVSVVASQLNEILKSYPPFQLFYDQAFAQNAESYVTQVAPLYQVFGLLSLIAVVVVTFLVSQLVAGKRSWEAGMLLTQGWSWNKITSNYFYYFLLLSLASFSLAAVVSIGLGNFFTATYLVYAQKVTLNASADPFYIATGLLLAILIPFFASLTVIRRLKRMGLDKILREY